MAIHTSARACIAIRLAVNWYDPHPCISLNKFWIFSSTWPFTRGFAAIATIAAFFSKQQRPSVTQKALLHLIRLNAPSSVLWNAHWSPSLESVLMRFHCFYTSERRLQEQPNHDESWRPYMWSTRDCYLFVARRKYGVLPVFSSNVAVLLATK